MDWYDKLADYFPSQEMKHPEHMRELLELHEAYNKHETSDYIVTFAEYPEFIFIDYFLVKPNVRGKGIGGKVLSEFKNKGKIILLEVEPPEVDGIDAQKRIRFYEKNGFRKAEHIVYTRTDDQGEPFDMDIYYWSPFAVAEQDIMQGIAKVCKDIHNFQSLKYYGREVANPDEVLGWIH